MVPQFVAPVRVEAYTSIAALATAVRNECDADARPTLAEVTHTLSAWAGGDSVDPEPADLSPGAAWWAPGHAPVDPPEAAKVKLAAAAAGRAFHAASLPMGGVGGGPIPPLLTHTHAHAHPPAPARPHDGPPEDVGVCDDGRAARVEHRGAGDHARRAGGPARPPHAAHRRDRGPQRRRDAALAHGGGPRAEAGRGAVDGACYHAGS